VKLATEAFHKFYCF